MREYGSEYPAVVLPDGYFEGLKSLKREITYLRSGREALMLASIAASSEKEKTILFPAYCCWSMSVPFEKIGWTIVYYRLNEDLTVDMECLTQLLNRVKVDAILTMNFYGSASTNEAVGVVKEKNKKIVVIEDFSHCTFSIKRIFNEDVDIYVSSLRKSIGICDGAIILSKGSMPLQYIQSEEPEFYERRYVAQMQKYRYNYTKDQKDKAVFLEEIWACESLLNEFTAVRPISDRTREMLTLVNGGEIAFARRENIRHLYNLLKGKVNMLPNLEICFDGSPFSLPILVNDQDDVQQKLAHNGIYAPILWPISDEARRICKNSAWMSDHMLSIPIDQRYGWDDIEEMADKILQIIIPYPNIK